MSGSESPTSSPTAPPKREVCFTCDRILTHQILVSDESADVFESCGSGCAEPCTFKLGTGSPDVDDSGSSGVPENASNSSSGVLSDPSRYVSDVEGLRILVGPERT